MIQIKNYITGEIIKELDAENLAGADLRGANLAGADLRGVEVSVYNDRFQISSIANYGIEVDEGSNAIPFSDITHIRAKDGVEIECSKEV